MVLILYGIIYLVIYQMIDISDKNMLVDITEFIIGNYSYKLLKKLNRYNQNKK
jgi:hypothetical protein